MAAYIGAVTFINPLKWTNKGELPTLGSDTLTRSGNVVMLRGVVDEDAPIDAKLLYDWEPLSTVNALRAMARTGDTYTADLEDSGTTYQVILAKDGITANKHSAFGDKARHYIVEGTDLDIYDGEISLWIVG